MRISWVPSGQGYRTQSDWQLDAARHPRRTHNHEARHWMLLLTLATPSTICLVMLLKAGAITGVFHLRLGSPTPSNFYAPIQLLGWHAPRPFSRHLRVENHLHSADQA